MSLEVIAGNRLLSEYMNLKHDADLHKHPFCKTSYTTSAGLRYHEKWDWLMAVVNKVEADEVTLKTGDDVHIFEVWIQREQCSIEWNTGNATGTLLYGDTAISSKIVRLWDLLVRFAKWYNEEVEKP